MDYQCSAIGEGIGSGKTGSAKSKPFRAKGLARKLLKLKNFILPEQRKENMQVTFAYHIVGDDNRMCAVDRKGYLQDFVLHRLEEAADPLYKGKTGKLGKNMLIDKMVDCLLELSADVAEDLSAGKDISFLVKYFSSQKESKARFSRGSFEIFQSEVIGAMKRYFG
jgi:hypothetical protein